MGKEKTIKENLSQNEERSEDGMTLDSSLLGGNEPQQQPQQPQQQPQQTTGEFIRYVIQNVVLAIIIQFAISAVFRSGLFGNGLSGANVVNSGAELANTDGETQALDQSSSGYKFQNVFTEGQHLLVIMLVSEMDGGEFTRLVENGARVTQFCENPMVEISKRFIDDRFHKLVYKSNKHTYGDWESGIGHDGYVYEDVEFDPPQSVTHNNGSLYLHSAVCGMCPTSIPAMPTQPCTMVSSSYNLVHYKLKKSKPASFHLLGTSTSSEANATEDSFQSGKGDEERDTTEDVIVGYWFSNATISLLTMDKIVNPAQLSPEIKGDFQFSLSEMTVKPPLFVNDFWNLQENYVEINASTTTLPLKIAFGPIGLFKYQLYRSFNIAFTTQVQWGTGSENEHDMMKKMIMETNPYYLGLTVTVSLLHSVFDILAFKNDIHFWKNRDNMIGLSLKSILLSLVFQVIIFLYLFDNEKTSWMILVQSGVGLLIQFWKITKAADVEVTWRWGFVPMIKLAEKKDYTSTTKEHDDKAFKYLGYVMGPLLLGYAIYSLIYNEHKGWYSYTVNMLAGAVYTFGFVQMTPQIFINYKLKSVAHMPWKMMTYRFLNTIVDDLFAFIVSMPTMHRIACFRDDIIFLVLLYQRWIYRVDTTRKNEFGVSKEDLDSCVSEGDDKKEK
eukprot:m.111999 g.111999  ORF g.111999 m.111999 type:complete len:669 (+) comp9244_c1_seq1:123-2129(+)